MWLRVLSLLKDQLHLELVRSSFSRLHTESTCNILEEKSDASVRRPCGFFVMNLTSWFLSRRLLSSTPNATPLRERSPPILSEDLLKVRLTGALSSVEANSSALLSTLRFSLSFSILLAWGWPQDRQLNDLWLSVGSANRSRTHIVRFNWLISLTMCALPCHRVPSCAHSVLNN